jgi:hypothetical protein
LVFLNQSMTPYVILDEKATIRLAIARSVKN